MTFPILCPLLPTPSKPLVTWNGAAAAQPLLFTPSLPGLRLEKCTEGNV